MLGSLRFILAIFVALSHIGWYPLGINPGISAVVVFYLISGFVVTGLWHKLQQSESPLKSFYIDRTLRIYPTYLAVTLIGFAVFYIWDIQSYFLSQELTLGRIAENLSIIPLNYYMWNSSDQFVIIPPAWSLGAEIQFYLLLPLILLMPKTVFVCSLFIAVIAQTGLIPREWFTYRLLPGVLHIFLCGAILASIQCQKLRYKWAAGLWTVYFLCLVMLIATGQLTSNRENELYPLGMFNVSIELLAGILIGIPLIVLLSPLKSPGWDQFLGHISYGIFLNHFIVLWFFTRSGPEFNVALYLAGSIMLSTVIWLLIEQYAQKWRYNIRKPSATLQS